MRKLLWIAGVAFALTGGSAQAATELAFTLTSELAGEAITFDLPQNPTPDAFSAGESFSFFNVDGTFNGVAEQFDEVDFFVPDLGDGNLHVADFSPFFGDQLYSGPESAPTFKTGTFDVSNGEIDYVLTIGAVPEPSTWALMLIGVAGIGLARYRRSVKAVAA
jgi:PEP-CTERM motif